MDSCLNHKLLKHFVHASRQSSHAFVHFHAKTKELSAHSIWKFYHESDQCWCSFLTLNFKEYYGT